MERIEDNLLKNEEILWKHITTTNLLQVPILKGLIGLSLVGIISILFNFVMYVFFSESFILILSLILLPIFTALIFGVSLIIPGMKDYFQIKKNLHSDYKNLKEYKEISIITSKRLIQKTYKAFTSYSEYPILDLKNYQINHDIIFVNLNSISVVSSEIDGSNYQIAFKHDEKDKNFIPLLYTIPLKQYNKFINILRELIPLKRKKRTGNFLVNYYKDENVSLER